MKRFEYYLDLMKKERTKFFRNYVGIIIFFTFAFAFLYYIDGINNRKWFYIALGIFVVLLETFIYLQVNKIINFASDNYRTNKIETMNVLKKKTILIKLFNNQFNSSYIDLAYNSLRYEDIYVDNINFLDINILYSYDLTKKLQPELNKELEDDYQRFLDNLHHIPEQFKDFIKNVGLDLNKPSYFEFDDEDGDLNLYVEYQIIGSLITSDDDIEKDVYIEKEGYSLEIFEYDDKINKEEYLILDVSLNIKLNNN